MTLTPGTRLGPYEITAAAGAGGMGEVYRARDTRLERSVAVKVLPGGMADDAERRQRFEREAKVVSSLNHPNICALYDVGNQDGTEYLVMEFVEGETLEKRLEKGPLAAELVLRYGMEMADALDKAHRKGVVHRDLKPANVMLTKAGVKLLDFGLAKWSGGESSEKDTLATLTSAPTKLTEQGTVLGTFQYMAPEQLQGEEADARTDIFALGALLYEMATARPAFAGKTRASLIAAILSAEPAPMAALEPMTPPALERLVRGCLVKDADERWQTAHDIKLQLRAIAEGGSQSGVPAPVSSRRKMREKVAWAVAGLALVAAGILGTMTLRPGAAKWAVMTHLLPPAGADFSLEGQQGAGLALSPDGRKVVFVGAEKQEGRALWVRPLDALAARRLAGTEGASYPFWSPDGKYVGFFANGKLKKVEETGGAPLTVCDAPNARGGTWNSAGVILFTPNIAEGIYRVSESGGMPERITSPKSANEFSHRWPEFLPGGKYFLYTSGNPLGPTSEERGIYAASLEGKTQKKILPEGSNAQYAGGYLYYVREGTLLAQRFDPGSLKVEGDAVAVAPQVIFEAPLVRGVFSVSGNTLIYAQAVAHQASVVWVDRTGKEHGRISATGGVNSLRLAPDGDRVAMDISNSNGRGIWTGSFSHGGSLSRLTFSQNEIQHGVPIWSPDGKKIAYESWLNARFDIRERNADGSGGEEVLVEAGNEALVLKFPSDWSRDGKYLIFENFYGMGSANMMVMELQGERKVYPALPDEKSSQRGRLSPDGKWLAYVSLETGRPEVYVTTFPKAGGKWQVSTEGGDYPAWKADGKELYYVSLVPVYSMTATEVKPKGTGMEFGAPRKLFRMNLQRTAWHLVDVSADGQKFVYVDAGERTNEPLVLVTNWEALLKR